MKPYSSPTFYSIEIESGPIANWGSLPFDKKGTDSFDEKPNGIEMGSRSDYFDSSSSRSNWKDYEQ